MLTFTGTGSSHCPQLGNCCAFVWHGEDLIMLDCGEDSFSSPLIQQALSQCRGQIWCVLTHLHGDHVGSLATLCLYCDGDLGKKVHVCYPTAAAGTLLELMGVRPESMILHVQFPLTLPGGMSITPVPTEHVDWMACYGYILCTEMGSCYYSGDANSVPLPALDAFKAGKLDFFFQDVSLHGARGGPHLTLDELCEIFPDHISRERVWVMHLDSQECGQRAADLGFHVVQRGEKCEYTARCCS